jgi:hypothetical protein
MGQSGEIVLDRVVVPEIVVVHDGPPKDTEADNYYVTYKDYIKNVASSEIYYQDFLYTTVLQPLL